jgi:Putative prokaryotic signal transducing protein
MSPDAAHDAPGAHAALVCPGCARAYPDSERFCRACGMPLVRAGAAEQPTNDRRRRARKIKPQYSRGALVKVARAANQAEAELIEGLLLEEGIPSMLLRSRGADVPDLLAAGPRDVLVPESGAQAAREALAWQRS